MTPDFDREYRRRQQVRARVTALVLGALVLLFFAITIAKLA
jgi:hypothetical protein